MRKLWMLVFMLLAIAATQAKPKASALPPLVKRSVNAIMAGDPKPLKGFMSPEVERGLTRSVLQSVKQQYVTPMGGLKSAAVVSQQTVQGMKVTLFVMHMDKGDLRWSLALAPGGKVAGLRMLPPQ